MSDLRDIIVFLEAWTIAVLNDKFVLRNMLGLNTPNEMLFLMLLGVAEHL
jgi:hypothetical protein